MALFTSFSYEFLYPPILRLYSKAQFIDQKTEAQKNFAHNIWGEEKSVHEPI